MIDHELAGTPLKQKDIPEPNRGSGLCREKIVKKEEGHQPLASVEYISSS